MLLLPLNLYTLLPLGTADEECLKIYLSDLYLWPLHSQFAWKMAFLIGWEDAGLVAALESLLS